MQRLARINLDKQNSAAVQLFSHYDEITTMLLRHLPPSTASMLARPEVKGNIVEWYSELQGQPYLLGNSERDQQARKQAEVLIAQRLAAVDKLRTELLQKGAITTEQASLLEKVVDAAQHDSIQIYIVNKQPVITGWGLGKKPIPVPPPVVAVPQKSRWWLWLLPLLLLLLGGLAWWLFFRPEPVKEEPTEPVKIEIAKPEPKPEPPKEEPKPEPQKLEFIPEPEPVKEEPLPEPEPVKEEPKPEPEPVKEEPKLEPVAEVKKKPQKNCRVVKKPTDVPQMAIIFNNASGMQYTLLESARTVIAFNDRWGMQGVTDEEIKYMFRQPNRSTASKKSVAQLIDRIPAAVDIGLVELKSCLSTSTATSFATNHGIFSGGQRGRLKAKLKNMHVRQHYATGTPIYEGLQKALTLVDGKEREALIVLITEGNDDCTHRNICQLIKQEKQARPKLKVNIVSINSIVDYTDCLAKETGGQIISGDMTSQAKLTNAIRKSMKSVEQEICE
ncbi:hypothetical protein [Aggregatibacter kilianii]|uniref:hypothetical protein n=1 Tax=Aggregatibacter kilianii TaxID=2025884 RepID=UPI000D6596D1|nr:hypothetical protein [Aggregatibacter kilianii]